MSCRTWKPRSKVIVSPPPRFSNHLQDHPSLLQSYVWQQYDVAPDLPRLNEFLEFWNSNLDGKLHSVRVATAGLLQPVQIAYADVQLTLH